jgi:hypothetical protein
MDLKRMVTAGVGGVVLSGATLGLAGCDGSDAIVTETPSPTAAPTDSAAESPSPSLSASPSPSASGAAAPLSDEELLELLPEGAERPDLVGALKTGEYFIQEFPRMMSTGETEVWDSLSLPGCEFCESSRANALKVQVDGWKVRGGEISQGESITEANLAEDGDVFVRYPTEQADIYVIKPGQEEELAGSSQTAFHYLQMWLVGTVWKVVGVDVSDE